MIQFVIKTHFVLNLYMMFIGVEGVTLAFFFWCGLVQLCFGRLNNNLRYALESKTPSWVCPMYLGV